MNKHDRIVFGSGIWLMGTGLLTLTFPLTDHLLGVWATCRIGFLASLLGGIVSLAITWAWVQPMVMVKFLTAHGHSPQMFDPVLAAVFFFAVFVVLVLAAFAGLAVAGGLSMVISGGARVGQGLALSR
jgi:hypothetical protein